MAPTQPLHEQVAELSSELDALKVLVKALAEIAEQPRLKPALTEHLEEQVNAMNAAGRSDDEIALFVEAFNALRDSY